VPMNRKKSIGNSIRNSTKELPRSPLPANRWELIALHYASTRDRRTLSKPTKTSLNNCGAAAGPLISFILLDSAPWGTVTRAFRLRAGKPLLPSLGLEKITHQPDKRLMNNSSLRLFVEDEGGQDLV